MLAGWVGALIAREVVRPVKVACSITAVTAVVVLDTVVFVGLLNYIGSRLRGLSDGMILANVLSWHFCVLLGATYWRSSRLVRIVETALTVATWVLALVLRMSSSWPFEPYGPDLNDVARYRMAGVVLPLVAAPLLIALLVAFWRDRNSASASANSAPSTPRSR